MAKRMLADVLWQAANEHLNDEPRESRFTEGVHKWSCWAIDRALGEKPSEYDALTGSHWSFLKRLGLDASPTNVLERTTPDSRVQGVRYMWLLLAMHAAED